MDNNLNQETNNILDGTGLVLAGGGGKGAYQVGVLKALKEKGLLDDITHISGVSIGAVNAMLYAMTYDTNDVELMYKVWSEIDMLTLFDIELEMLMENRPYFSRSQFLSMMGKYIDFDKLKTSTYRIYAGLCKQVKDAAGNIVSQTPEYRCLNDYDTETIKSILLASTALPIVYEAVNINGATYRDGGICDNEPVKPLYDAGIRNFIIIGNKYGKVFDQSKWPDANFITIYPSHDIGQLIDGTLDFTSYSIQFREKLGYKDGLRALKTKFNKEEIYINLERVLAENDYNDVIRELRMETKVKSVETRINSNIDKFNEIAKKFDKY